MNLNKNKLPPSPRSRNARKPLYNLTNLQNIETKSLDRDKNYNKNIQNIHINGSLEKYNRNVNKQIRYQKQNNKQHIYRGENEKYVNAQRVKQNNQIKQIVCSKHIDRPACAKIMRKVQHGLCFQCALYQARKGSKVQNISKKPQNQPQSQQSKRQKLINQYLYKNKQAQKNIKLSLQKIQTFFNNKFQQLQQTLLIEKDTLQYNLQFLMKQYNYKVKQIQQTKQIFNEVKVNLLKNFDQKCSILKCNRNDVIENIQDCINSFTRADFDVVMKKYKQQIQSMVCTASASLQKAQESIKNQLIKLQTNLKSCKKNHRQFTFSKGQNQSLLSPSSHKKHKIHGVQSIISTNKTDKATNIIDSLCCNEMLL